MRPQVVVAVAVRVGLELDDRRRRRATPVHVHGQVWDRTGGEDPEVTGQRPEGEILIEEHHVDHRSRDPAGLGGHTQVTQNVLDVAALVPHCPHQFVLDPGHEVADGVVGSDLHPQWRNVGEHAAGTAQYSGGARGQRNVHEHVLPSRPPREVAGEGGDQRGCCRRARPAVGVLEPCDGIGGQRRAHGQAVGGGWSLDVGQGGAVRACVETFGPVVTVGREPVGRPVVAFEAVQGVQVGCTVRFELETVDRRGVQGGDTVDHRHRPVSVEGDVVDPAVPQVPLVTDPQQ